MIFVDRVSHNLLHTLLTTVCVGLNPNQSARLLDEFNVAQHLIVAEVLIRNNGWSRLPTRLCAMAAEEGDVALVLVDCLAQYEALLEDPNAVIDDLSHRLCSRDGDLRREVILKIQGADWKDVPNLERYRNIFFLPHIGTKY